jgi:hypothetical protein
VAVELLCRCGRAMRYGGELSFAADAEAGGAQSSLLSGSSVARGCGARRVATFQKVSRAAAENHSPTSQLATHHDRKD